MKTEQVSSPVISVGRPLWPLHQAIILGFLGGITVLLVSFVIAVSAFGQQLSHIFSFGKLVALETIAQCIAALGAAYLALKVLRKHQIQDFWGSIQWRKNNLMIAVFAGMGLLSSLLIRYFFVRNFSVGPAFSAILTDQVFLYVVLGTVILQPLIEEIYFRGILFEALSFKVGQILGISIVTAIFVLMHSQHQWIVLPISLVLAITRLATRSTANCFALHAAYNLGVVVWGLS